MSISEMGAGLELEPTEWGMKILAVESEPGQPELQAGDTIVEIMGEA